MPPAPHNEAAWLSAVTQRLASGVHGTSAQAWLRSRHLRATSGERLAVVLGIDDVIVSTHFAGLDHIVAPVADVVRTAEQLGYGIFYVTGRTEGPSLRTIRTALTRAGIAGQGVCPRPSAAVGLEAAKTACRTQIAAAGYKVAMSIAASEVSFDGAHPAEVDVALPDFATPQGF